MKSQIIGLITILILPFLAIAQPSQLIESGYQKLEAKEYSAAISDFSQVLKDNPRDTSALSGIIRAYTLSENFKEAQRYIDNAIKEYPNSPEFYLRRGILNNLRGQPRKAISDFDKALDLGSGQILVLIYINRGAAHLKDEGFDKALDDFSAALEINPRSTSALNYKAFINYRQGNFQDAIADYDKSLDLDPENSMGYYNRGMAHLRTGNKVKACADFHASCSRGNMNACRMIMAECGGK
jgi:tetratricopeptide (TPR) repeat protein